MLRQPSLRVVREGDRDGLLLLWRVSPLQGIGVVFACGQGKVNRSRSKRSCSIGLVVRCPILPAATLTQESQGQNCHPPQYSHPQKAHRDPCLESEEEEKRRWDNSKQNKQQKQNKNQPFRAISSLSCWLFSIRWTARYALSLPCLKKLWVRSWAAVGLKKRRGRQPESKGKLQQEKKHKLRTVLQDFWRDSWQPWGKTTLRVPFCILAEGDTSCASCSTGSWAAPTHYMGCCRSPTPAQSFQNCRYQLLYHAQYPARQKKKKK